jgi:hypothetical protein
MVATIDRRHEADVNAMRSFSYEPRDVTRFSQADAEVVIFVRQSRNIRFIGPIVIFLRWT